MILKMTGATLWIFIGCFALFFIWLFYKGYKAYKKNGWNDPFFHNNDDFGGDIGGF